MDMEERKLMGTRIRQCRKEAGFSQDELAERLDMKRSNIAGYEAGRVIPPGNIIKQLADIFSISTDFLLGGTNDPHGYARPNHSKSITEENYAEGYGSEEPTKDEEAFQRMERLLERVTEGSRFNRRFKDSVVSKITEELAHIRDVLNEEFDFSPNGILLACEGASAGFVEEFIAVFERAEKSLNNSTLTPKEEHDIATALEQLMANLASKDALAFDGEPMTDDDKELIRDSIEHSLRTARQVAKRKFTPKKYRKD